MIHNEVASSLPTKGPFHRHFASHRTIDRRLAAFEATLATWVVTLESGQSDAMNIEIMGSAVLRPKVALTGPLGAPAVARPTLSLGLTWRALRLALTSFVAIATGRG